MLLKLQHLHGRNILTVCHLIKAISDYINVSQNSTSLPHVILINYSYTPK